MTARRAALLALAAGLLVWLPSLQVGFLYDDEVRVVGNRAIRDLSAPLTVWRGDPTRPLLSFTFALNHAVAGLTPWPWHLVNVVIHAANAALVALLAGAFALRRGHAAPARVAALAGVFFAVTPMAAETAGYVTSRSSALCATFVLAAVLVALPALEAAPRAGLAPALLLFVLALATKEEAASLPLLLLLVDLVFVAKGDARSTAGRWRVHLPFLVLPVAGLVARRAAAGSWLPAPAHPLGDWLLTQLGVFPAYVLRALIPFDPALFRGARLVDVSSASGLLGLVAGAGLLLFAALRVRRASPAAFAILWMAAALVPSSTLVVLKEVAVDHRAYLGTAGVAWLVGTWLAGPGRLPFAIAVLLMMAGRSVQVQNVLKDPVAVWSDAVRRAPRSPEARTQLGEVLLRTGDPRAGRVLEDVVRIAPREPRAWANLASWLAEVGRREEAVRALERAVELAPGDPRFRHNLALLYEAVGRGDDAVRELRAAVAAPPPLARPRIDLARLLAARGAAAEARTLLDDAARLEIDERDVTAIETLRARLR